MARFKWHAGVRWISEYTTLLWILAIGLFGVYDVAIVFLGLPLVEFIRTGPITAPLFHRYGITAMIVAKLLVFGVCYHLWTVAPKPHASGVPLGLAVLGILTALWDTYVIVQAILGP